MFFGILELVGFILAISLAVYYGPREIQVLGPKATFLQTVGCVVGMIVGVFGLVTLLGVMLT